MRENVNRKNKSVLDIVYIGVFAAIIAVCAWIAIPLTAVSVTLQTFGICVTAGLLGWKRGSLCVLTYILLGMIGLPVFSGFKSGIAAITGPTGGYIVGFVFTAIIIGFAVEKLSAKYWVCFSAMCAGVAACYLFGTIWYMVMYKVSFGSAFLTCVAGFIIFDVIKVALASALVNRLKKFVK